MRFTYTNIEELSLTINALKLIEWMNAQAEMFDMPLNTGGLIQSKR